MSHLESPWTQAVSYLEMFFGEKRLSSGTCFFWKQDDRTFLVTNWHNLSGLNPATTSPMSATGGVPDNIRFLTYKRSSDSLPGGFYEMSLVTVQLPLYISSDLKSAIWIEHPTFGRKVDIGAIDITDHISGLFISHVNEVEDDALLDPFVSQDVFILGYPLGLITGSPSPVWKRGSIASDPSFDPEDLPKIIVDTATRSGMSGSVVVARHIVVGQAILKKDGTKTNAVLYARRDTVLGIYSGRIGVGDLEAQLGIVWKRPTIVETILGRRNASPHS